MSRALITIHSTADRERATKWIGQAPTGTRVEFKQAKRSSEQNDKLWAMLTEVAAQVPWHGMKLSADDWKFIFMDALKRELRVVPNIDGTGFVNLGRSSSDLSKSEMSDLIELIHAFGAQHGVVFRDTDSSQAQASPSTIETDAPTAGSAPLDSAAGQQSQESSRAEHADDKGPGDGVSESTAPSPDAEASLLSDDWQSVYLRAMSRVTDRPKSLLNRHTEALQMIGGKANAAEQEWMRAVYKLTERRLQGEITKDDCDAAIREIAG